MFKRVVNIINSFTIKPRIMKNEKINVIIKTSNSNNSLIVLNILYRI